MAGKDITGQRFTKLVAVRRLGRHPRGGFVWLCQCDCGNTKEVITKDLGYGSVKSCGCLHAETEAKKRKVKVGDKFGMLTVVRQSEHKGIHIRWDCLCDCGKSTNRSTNNLRTANNPNCGCARKTKASNIVGLRSGKLVVVERDKTVDSPRAHWRCQCDCGNTCVVSGTSLRRGDTKSCGCLVKEAARQNIQKAIDSAANIHRTHGMSNTKAFRIWSHMIERCQAKDSYVRRGIKVCDEWLNSFEAFYEHVGDRPTPKHQLDRIDNDQGYKPGNVRWVLPKVNARNKSDNHMLTFAGETRCLAEWADLKDVTASALYWRIQKGWTPDKALHTPVRQKAPNGSGRQKRT